MLAVITGDIAHSSKVPPDTMQQAHRQIEQVIADFQAVSECRGELYRGDALQIMVPKIQYAPVICIGLIAALAVEGLQVTLSLAIAPTKSAERVALSQGPAFVMSGQGLEETPRGGWSVHSSDSELTARLSLASELMGFILSRLTSKQAEILYYWLTHERCEQQQIANAFSMTRQNVSLHWRKAAGPHILRYLQQVEAWSTQ